MFYNGLVFWEIRSFESCEVGLAYLEVEFKILRLDYPIILLYI